MNLYNAHTQFEQYKQARGIIGGLYNEATGNDERHNVTLSDFSQPELCWALELPESMGGLVIEQLANNPKMAIITYAALNKEVRGESLIRLLIKLANKSLISQNGSMIMGVQLNPSDNKTIWKHLGFVELAYMGNLTEVLLVTEETYQQYL